MAIISPRAWILAAVFYFGPLVLGGSAAAAAAQDIERNAELAALLAGDRQGRFGVLPNGLRYVIWPWRSHAGHVSLRLSLAVGSLDEEEHEQGFAHLLEHMAFRGGRYFADGELLRRFGAIGVRSGTDLNAYTSYRHTVYWLDLPDNRLELLEQAFAAIADIAMYLALDPQHLKIEQQVVREEWRRKLGPNERLFRQFREAVFPGTRFARRPPIGDPEIFAQAQASDLQRFYRETYVPERAMLVVVGDVEVAATEQLIRTHLGAWRARRHSRAPMDHEIRADRRETRAVLLSDPELEEANLTILWTEEKRKPRSLPEWREQLTDRVLGYLLGRRLERALQLSQLTFSFAWVSTEIPFEPVQTWSIQVSGLAAQEWRSTMETVVRAMSHWHQEPVTQEELEHARRFFRTVSASRAERWPASNPSKVADSLLGWLQDSLPLYTPPFYAQLIERLMPTITPADLRDSLVRQFEPSRPRVYLLALPQRYVSAEVKTHLDRIVQSASMPPAGQMSTQALIPRHLPLSVPHEACVESKERVQISPLHGMRRVALANGVRVTLQALPEDKGVVLVMARLFHPAMIATPRAVILTRDISRLFDQPRLGPVDGLTLQDWLAERGIILFSGHTHAGLHLYLRSPSRQLEPALHVLYGLLTEASVDPVYWERLRKIAELDKEKNKRDLDYELTKQHRRLLARGDPRWLALLDTENELQPFALLERFYREVVAPAPLEVMVVGDIEPNQAERLAACYLGALPSRATPLEPEAVHAALANRGTQAIAGSYKVEVATAAPRAHLSLLWPLPERLEPREQIGLRLLASILEERYHEQARHRQGLVYGAHWRSADYSLWPQQVASLQMDTSGEPGSVERLFALALELVAQIARDGPHPDELEAQRRQYLVAHERQRRDALPWLFQLIFLSHAPEQFELWMQTPALLAGLDVEFLRSLARRYLAPEQAVRFWVVPQPTGALETDQ